jgi:hypothetical protein
VRVGVTESWSAPGPKSAIDKWNLASFSRNAKVPSLLAKPDPFIDVLTCPALQLLDVTGPCSFWSLQLWRSLLLFSTIFR